MSRRMRWASTLGLLVVLLGAAQASDASYAPAATLAGQGNAVDVLAGVVAVGRRGFNGVGERGYVTLYNCSGIAAGGGGGGDGCSVQEVVTSTSESFGEPVVLFRGGAWMAVGESGYQGNVGAVHLLDCTGACSQVALLQSPVQVQGAYFGRAIAVRDALVFVGSTGYAYVYDCAALPTGGGCTLVKELKESTHNTFAWSLAVSGPILAVSAAGDGLGAIFLFNCTTSACPLLLKLVPGLPTDSLLTYITLAIGGNLVVADALSGVDDEDVIYVYECDFGAPACAVRDRLKAPGPVATGSYGWSASTDGATLAIGEPNRAGVGGGVLGAVHVYDCASADGRCPLLQTLKPSARRAQRGVEATAPGGEFGESVAMDGPLLVGTDDDYEGSSIVFTT